MANHEIETHDLSDIVPSKAKRDDVKMDNEIVKLFNNEEQVENLKNEAPQMRLKSDDLGIWESVLRHKFIMFVAMAAAFSASLDGYRKLNHSRQNL